jgi:hypothetical protein
VLIDSVKNYNTGPWLGVFYSTSCATESLMKGKNQYN